MMHVVMHRNVAHYYVVKVYIPHVSQHGEINWDYGKNGVPLCGIYPVE